MGCIGPRAAKYRHRTHQTLEGVRSYCRAVRRRCNVGARTPEPSAAHTGAVAHHARLASLVPLERLGGIPRAVVAALILSSIALAGGIAINRRRHDGTPFPGMRTFSTRRGQRADLRLNDGTQIVLGAATTVRIADDFGHLARNVYLDGEAYFVVHHDPARPFVVHAGHALVRDVGTRFAVTAYGGATPTQIVVAEGEVGVARVELRAMIWRSSIPPDGSRWSATE